MNTLKKPSSATSAGVATLASVAIVTLIAIYFTIQVVSMFTADVLYTKGLKTHKTEYFQKAIKLNKTEPAYYSDLAVILTAKATIETTEDTKQNLAQQADVYAKTAYLLNSVNSLTLKTLAGLYYKLVKIDKKYVYEELAVTAKLIDLSPTEPRNFYTAALAYIQAGDVETAKILNQKALELKQDYNKAIELEKLLTSINYFISDTY